jgi:hypothetical protein
MKVGKCKSCHQERVFEHFLVTMARLPLPYLEFLTFFIPSCQQSSILQKLEFSSGQVFFRKSWTWNKNVNNIVFYSKYMYVVFLFSVFATDESSHKP